MLHRCVAPCQPKHSGILRTLPRNSSTLARAALYCTLASAVAILLSIAVSQILLGLGFVLILVSGQTRRLPAAWLPLALFLAGTLVSLAFSPDPAAGTPQLKKIFVFLMLLTVFCVVREMLWIRRLIFAWAAVGAVDASVALVQYGQKIREARELGLSFYQYYVEKRITGAMSHWMTFGGTEMFVLLMLAAYLLFSGGQTRKREYRVLLGCAGVIVAALILGETRSIWLAIAVAGVYLVWCWKPRLLFVLPVAVALVLAVAPSSVRERFTSFYRPQREIDSNQHRIVTWRTGMQMIRAHPWLGLGPEIVGRDFNVYVPADIPRPLPRGFYGHLHNIYLQYAAERGIPVLLALLWWLGKMLLDFARGIRRLPTGPSDARAVLQGAVAVMIATLIAGFFEVNLGDSEVLTVFLAVMACGYVTLYEMGPLHVPGQG
jgi:putative inorganic carbon (hco3(-)) transporter